MKLLITEISFFYISTILAVTSGFLTLSFFSMILHDAPTTNQQIWFPHIQQGKNTECTNQNKRLFHKTTSLQFKVYLLAASLNEGSSASSCCFLKAA